MFILYAVAIGLVIGTLLGGRLSALASVEFRWPWLAIGGFVVQLLLFTEAGGNALGDAAPLVYVGSTAAVLIAVVRNIAIPGLVIVALGASSNLVTIVANGGFMPANAGAFAALGRGLNPGYTNSEIVEHPALEPLTDMYALPTWMPFANVFSIGDVLIAVGVVIVIAAGMRAGRGRAAEAAPAEAAPAEAAAAEVAAAEVAVQSESSAR